MTVWVVGAQGFLGKHLVSALRTRGIKHHTASKDGAGSDYSVDLLNEKTFVQIPIQQSDTVVLLAGISAPDICQNQFDTAYEVNVRGTTNFISRVLAREAKVLFASSDTVYGNQANPVDETEPCNPVGNYAIMKHKVEEAFVSNPHFVAFRLSYIVAENDKFTHFLRSQSGTGGEVEVFSDLIRNSIAIEDVVEGITRICEDWNRLEGDSVINFCGAVSESRAELAAKIIRNFGLDLKIKSVLAPQGFFDSRPRIINLSNERLRKLLA